jgi:hypothetical protein
MRSPPTVYLWLKIYSGYFRILCLNNGKCVLFNVRTECLNTVIFIRTACFKEFIPRLVLSTFRDDNNRSSYLIFICLTWRTERNVYWWRRLLQGIENIGCRMLFISSGTPGIWPKIRHPAELGVITRVSSMWCAEGLPWQVTILQQPRQFWTQHCGCGGLEVNFSLSTTWRRIWGADV